MLKLDISQMSSHSILTNTLIFRILFIFLLERMPYAMGPGRIMADAWGEIGREIHQGMTLGDAMSWMFAKDQLWRVQQEVLGMRDKVTNTYHFLRKKWGCLNHTMTVESVCDHFQQGFWKASAEWYSLGCRRACGAKYRTWWFLQTLGCC